jgi:hypothetical protein
MTTVIEVLEVWIEQEVLQHLLPKGSTLIGRGIIGGVNVTHLESQRWSLYYV